MAKATVHVNSSRSTQGERRLDGHYSNTEQANSGISTHVATVSIYRPVQWVPSRDMKLITHL